MLSDEYKRNNIKIENNTVSVDLYYPRLEEIMPDAVEINIIDVRSADPIRIEYDFNHNGWVIKQSREQKDGKEQWVEVGYFQVREMEEDKCNTCNELKEDRHMSCPNCGDVYIC